MVALVLKGWYDAMRTWQMVTLAIAQVCAATGKKMSTIATREGHLTHFLVGRLKKVVLVLKVRTSASSIQAFVAMCVVIIEGRNIAMDLITLPFVQKLQMEVVHAQKVLRSVDKVRCYK